MKVTKKGLRLFRAVCLLFCLISAIVMFFFSKAIGGFLLALSIFFLFTPHKEGDDL